MSLELPYDYRGLTTQIPAAAVSGSWHLWTVLREPEIDYEALVVHCNEPRRIEALSKCGYLTRLRRCPER
jgi:HrpA-like RNA helicase